MEQIHPLNEVRVRFLFAIYYWVLYLRERQRQIHEILLIGFSTQQLSFYVPKHGSKTLSNNPHPRYAYSPTLRMTLIDAYHPLIEV